jgi:hypothetical protein
VWGHAECGCPTVPTDNDAIPTSTTSEDHKVSRASSEANRTILYIHRFAQIIDQPPVEWAHI